MNYELAKKLKDAGFPAVTRWEAENNYRRSISVTGEETLPPLGALLSELDAQLEPGDGEILLFQADGKWHAAGWGGEFFGDHYIDGDLAYLNEGTTPEEAVANLWLALREQKEPNAPK